MSVDGVLGTTENLPDEREWKRKRSFWKSDVYEATFHIPFTRVEVEFGFVNSSPRTIEYDRLVYTPNPKEVTVGNISRRKYYTFDGVKRYERIDKNHRRQDVLELARSDDPEITITPANQTFKTVEEKHERVAIVTAPVFETATFDGSQAMWKLAEDVTPNSLDVTTVPREDLDEVEESYPTGGVFD